MTDAEYLRAARKALGYTLHQMGLALGYADTKNLRNGMSRLERGERTVTEFRMMKLKELLKRKRISLDSLSQ